MVVFPCQVCKTSLSADDGQAGLLVRCPTCLSAVQVPRAAAPMEELATAGAAAPEPRRYTAAQTAVAPPPRRTAPSPPPVSPPRSGGGRQYGFPCGYCGSPLHANESMGGQDGNCPTCGNNITVPILDRYDRLIDPKTRQIIRQDPHPVHAYAAAGERAPQILRQRDGKQVIRCPRCKTMSAITANTCKSCGTPFTLEGAATNVAKPGNSFCSASLGLGIIGLFPVCGLIPALLAIIFAFVGYHRVVAGGDDPGRRKMAIAGGILGAVGVGMTLLFGLRL